MPGQFRPQIFIFLSSTYTQKQTIPSLREFIFNAVDSMGCALCGYLRLGLSVSDGLVDVASVGRALQFDKKREGSYKCDFDSVRIDGLSVSTADIRRCRLQVSGQFRGVLSIVGGLG